MASLKGERARAGAALRTSQPKPLGIQKPPVEFEKTVMTERAKKGVLGLGLVFGLTLLLADYGAVGKLDLHEIFEYFLGLFFIVALPLHVLYWDIRRYRRALTQDFMKLLLICVILLGVVAISRLSMEMFSMFTERIPGVGKGAGYYAVPFATAAMLATLLFDIHIGIVVSIVMSIFAGILIPNEGLFFFYTFMGSIVASFSVVRCSQRSALLKAGLYLAIASLVTGICMDLYQRELFTKLGLYDMMAAIFGGFLVAILVSGILPLLESAFGMVTDISLLEYSDLNRPLLKKMMVTAPGTYHHSVIIGSLAEAAAESVGVNPLMARVAAYYHDIGKIKKPEYFVENQAMGENRHDRLTPSMSSLIISSHVKDGYELAREFKLPPQIAEIIQQHHGTALMTYFYEKAKDGEVDPTCVNDEDYRYPGPKPQTKVAAIVMLADAVEAASRVLDNPTPQRIAALVDKIVNKFFQDEQLTECELTLRDLTEMKKNFNMLLSGIYHHRIDYPGMGIPSGGKKVAGANTKLPEEHKGPDWHAEELGHEADVVSGTPKG